jgi:hypothetical protein
MTNAHIVVALAQPESMTAKDRMASSPKLNMM